MPAVAANAESKHNQNKQTATTKDNQQKKKKKSRSLLSKVSINIASFHQGQWNTERENGSHKFC